VALRKALASLPDRQRLAIVLRHLEERPNPEIAAILETSVEAVESLLARGRRALATELAPRRSELGLAD
jgi:RNA polymerase sigma-70 factor (ECF subfamily)